MKKITFLLLATTAIFTSCKKDKDSTNQTGVFNSEEINFFEGKAKTWIKVSNGVPEQLAISIDDAAMNSLPMTDEGSEEEGHVIIPLHPQSGSTAFDHVLVDWNPHGHEPEGVYNVPHFDFHFYTSTVEEQMSIPLYEEDSLKFKNYPGAAYMPATYVPIPGGVPMMGAHWFDVTTPEMNGAPFTQTFLMGSFDGKVTFFEPMITLDFLKNTTQFERTIPQAASFQKNAYYPTKMKVSKHDGVTEIILDGFTYRQQG
jgi:hypothetical protein